MGGIAFVFSGQGDQYPGMGKALYDNCAAARRVFDLCEEIRPGTAAQCFTGTADALQQTANTQPCLFAMELAAAEVLREKGIVPDAVAGFSLGEVSAAAFAGVFSVRTGFRLVCRRGELMQREAEKQDTAMAAVVKLTPETVEALCGRYPDVYPVNFNCPGQTTVSGIKDQLSAFAGDVRAAGGRCIPLKVGGAFHSPFMRGAAEAFAEELAKADLRAGTIPLYSNVTARPYGDDAAALLARQIVSPVRWEQTIRNLIAAGIDTFVEIGPGRTLINMVKKIDPQVTTRAFAEYLEEMPC